MKTSRTSCGAAWFAGRVRPEMQEVLSCASPRTWCGGPGVPQPWRGRLRDFHVPDRYAELTPRNPGLRGADNGRARAVQQRPGRLQPGGVGVGRGPGVLRRWARSGVWRPARHRVPTPSGASCGTSVAGGSTGLRPRRRRPGQPAGQRRRPDLSPAHGDRRHRPCIPVVALVDGDRFDRLSASTATSGPARLRPRVQWAGGRLA